MDIKQYTSKQPVCQEEFKREIKKYLGTTENGNMAYQNLWNTGKPVPKGK